MGVALLCLFFYSRRPWKIEVQGNLLSVQNGTVYLLAPDQADLIIFAIVPNSQKPQEFLRLPVEKTDPTSFVFDVGYLYYFQGSRNQNDYRESQIWEDGAIYRIPLSGGKPECIVSHVHISGFAVLSSALYYLEPILSKNKTVRPSNFNLIATDLHTRSKRTITAKYPVYSKPRCYDKGVLWTEYDQKVQGTFLMLYEPASSQFKRFGPYSDVTILRQTSQNAFWTTRKTAKDVTHFHRFDSSTGSETETILPIENEITTQVAPLDGTRILLVRPLASSQQTASTGAARPAILELFEYPMIQNRRTLARLSSLPISFFADNDWLYYVTMEVESDWMNFSFDNRLKSKYWLNRIKIPR